MSDKPVIVIGAGGHARVLIDVLRSLDRRVLFATDRDSSLHGREIYGVRVEGDDPRILDHPPEDVDLVNGIGSVSTTGARRRVFEGLRAEGYRFVAVVHPASVIAGSAELGEGVQIMAGAVIQPGATIGANVLVNTGASVDHDCVLGSHTHVAPGVVLSGGVRVGEGAHLGTGAVVIQNIEIGADAIVGAGSVVIDDVPPATTVVGTPARSIRGDSRSREGTGS